MLYATHYGSAFYTWHVLCIGTKVYEFDGKKLHLINTKMLFLQCVYRL